MMTTSKVIYFHRGKESNFDLQEELELTDKQMENFMYTGSEVAVTIEVDDDGNAWATHFAGQKLDKRVFI